MVLTFNGKKCNNNIIKSFIIKPLKWAMLNRANQTRGFKFYSDV